MLRNYSGLADGSLPGPCPAWRAVSRDEESCLIFAQPARWAFGPKAACCGQIETWHRL